MVGGSLFRNGHGLWWRLPVCGVAGVLAFQFLSSAQIASGTIALSVAAICAAPVLAEWGAPMFFGWLGGFLYPDRPDRHPPPTYGPVEALRMAGHCREAIEGYEAILVRRPRDGRSHLALMDIAWRDLGDARMAMDFYHRARLAVRNPEWLREMEHAYEDFASALPGRRGSLGSQERPGDR